MNKNISRNIGIIIIYLISFLFIRYYSEINFINEFGGSFEGFGFIFLLFILTFIHLFFFKKLSKKIIVGAIDLLPIIIFAFFFDFMLIGSQGILQYVLTFFVFFLIPLVIIVLLNLGIEWVLGKIKK